MTRDEEIRALVIKEMELFIKANGWDDKVVQEALLEVAKNHIWKKGLWIRLRVLTVVAAGITAIGSMIAMIATFFGWGR